MTVVICHDWDWVSSVIVAVKGGVSGEVERVRSEEKNEDGDGDRGWWCDTYLIWRWAVGRLWEAPLRIAAIVDVVVVVVVVVVRSLHNAPRMRLDTVEKSKWVQRPRAVSSFQRGQKW